MTYSVSPGNIFGRIGTSIGKGLAESIPKEAERYRLSQALNEIGNNPNLNQFQRFAALASAPGSTPQIVQTGGELLRQQQLMDAYKRSASGQQPEQNLSAQPKGTQNFRDIQFGGDKFQQQVSKSGQTIPSNYPSREAEVQAERGAVRENPLQEKFIPAAPWDQQKQEQAINEAFNKGLATTFDQANAYANQQREFYEQAPEKYQQQLDYRKKIDTEVDDRFDKELQTRLQKEGKETFKDIPGDLQLNIKKKARNAVATGKMTPEQAGEYYSKKALDLVKNKGQALKIANRDFSDRILPHKKDEAIKNLQNIAKNYKDMGADEDFYNFLTSNGIDENGQQQGMGLSPGGAAIIQYDRTPQVKNLIKNTKISYKNPSESTRAFAEDLSKVMTPQDSFLAIARQMKQQDHRFDEYAFFDYLRENKNQYGSNPRLDREVIQGVSDFFPNWGDIILFPAFSKSVAND